MRRVRLAALLLCLISCKGKTDGAAARSGAPDAGLAAAATAPKLDLPAPRLAKVAKAAIVDTTFGDPGGSFVVDYRARPALAADGNVLVCGEGPRLFRLTPEGRPDRSFGQGGLVPLGGDACKNVVPTGGGEAYVEIGRDSLLAPTRVMRMSPRGELLEVAPERELRKLAIDGDGHLFDLRADKEHVLYLDALAPKADSVKLDTKPEKDTVFRFGFAGQTPLLWSAFFFEGEKPDSKLMRFAPNGERDKTFASDGILRWPKRWQPKCGYFEGVVSLEDGRLVVTAAGCVALLDAKGRLDPQFGREGIVELSSEVTCDSSPVVLPDGRIVLVAHDTRKSARLVTLTQKGAKTETVLVEGPVSSSRLAGVDAHGRVLVEVGMHRYVTEKTTDQETVMVMTRP
jgi:hypothetical protein